MESGLHQAGRILVLVGAILSTVGAAFLLIAAVGFLFLGYFAGVASGGAVVGAGVYVVLGLLQAVGAVFGFVAHARARAGNVHGAWVFALVSSLLPPLQVVTLIGAVLLLTSPEHEAHKRS